MGRRGGGGGARGMAFSVQSPEPQGLPSSMAAYFWSCTHLWVSLLGGAKTGPALVWTAASTIEEGPTRVPSSSLSRLSALELGRAWRARELRLGRRVAPARTQVSAASQPAIAAVHNFVQASTAQARSWAVLASRADRLRKQARNRERPGSAPAAASRASNLPLLRLEAMVGPLPPLPGDTCVRS